MTKPSTQCCLYPLFFLHKRLFFFPQHRTNKPIYYRHVSLHRLLFRKYKKGLCTCGEMMWAPCVVVLLVSQGEFKPARRGPKPETCLDCRSRPWQLAHRNIVRSDPQQLQKRGTINVRTWENKVESYAKRTKSTTFWDIMFQSTWHWQVAPCIIQELIDASELGGNPPRTPMISLGACCDISNAYMHVGLTEYHFELLQWHFSLMDQPPWFSHTNVDLFPSPWNKRGIFSLLTFYPVHISIDTQHNSVACWFFFNNMAVKKLYSWGCTLFWYLLGKHVAFN